MIKKKIKKNNYECIFCPDNDDIGIVCQSGLAHVQWRDRKHIEEKCWTEIGGSIKKGEHI